MPDKPPYSVAQAAERLGVHTDTVRSAVKSGVLRHFRIGTRIFIPRDYLDRMATEGLADAR